MLTERQKSVLDFIQRIKDSVRHGQYRFGGTDLHAQASVLDLYDPDRSRGVTHRDMKLTNILISSPLDDPVSSAG